jgi:hypothetical protein
VPPWILTITLFTQKSINGPPVDGVVRWFPKRGWDFLFSTLDEKAATDLSLLSTQRWTTFKADDILTVFGPDLSRKKRRWLSAARHLAR